MTIDEAISALEELRDEMGGESPLLVPLRGKLLESKMRKVYFHNDGGWRYVRDHENGFTGTKGVSIEPWTDKPLHPLSK